MWRKKRPDRTPAPSDHVYVIAHQDKYLSKCNHSDCPTWVYLSHCCVGWWKRDTVPKNRVELMWEFGLYPSGPRVKAAVERVEFHRLGKAPAGVDVPTVNIPKD